MERCYKAADLLLPDFNKVSPTKWAVVACDQFTSEPEYWESARATVGDAPSTLDMILPEVYLSEEKERIPKINEKMKQYACELLVEHKDSMIYIERTQSDGSVRRGVLLSVDLEKYDYTKGADSLIRATEATVIERIPPRVAIRRGATVELPHIMLLIDDPEATVIEPLAKCENMSLAYDFELMLGGGHIKGSFIPESEQRRISDSLDALISPENIAKRYGGANISPLLFAVGDGNHSLASAKTLYEEIKTKIGEKAALSHPSRFALCEVVNIHDEALKFEPIYRVMFGVCPADVLSELQKYAEKLCGGADTQKVEYIYGSDKKRRELVFEKPSLQLTVGTLQVFIDEYIASHPSVTVDYIHGESSVEALAGRDDTIGFIFDGMAKSQLFKTVIFDGALPRKTFSMGHAVDKRYYLEGRKIVIN